MHSSAMQMHDTTEQLHRFFTVISQRNSERDTMLVMNVVAAQLSGDMGTAVLSAHPLKMLDAVSTVRERRIRPYTVERSFVAGVPVYIG